VRHGHHAVEAVARLAPLDLGHLVVQVQPTFLAPVPIVITHRSSSGKSSATCCRHAVTAAYAKELAPYLAGKGTIRSPWIVLCPQHS
jgi:hypothetical protein